MRDRKVFGVPLLIVVGAVAAIVAVILAILVVTNIGSIIDWVVGAIEDVWGFVWHRDSRIDSAIIECSESSGCRFWHPIIYSALLLLVVVTGFAYATLLERKLVAWFQNRIGPNRIGPSGLLQPLADGIKLVFKEDIMPAQANRPVYLMAPMLKVVPTLVVLAVIPLGPPLVIPWFNGEWYRVPLTVAPNMNVGILWVFAITSLATYGVVLAGWSSSNKYAMLGALRASAQMISYELAMGLALAVPVMIVGSMNITKIIEAQNGFPVLGWFVFQNPLAAFILMVALLAETNRAPFDLPEAEQELTAGYMTEYSGMKFALFMMAEYLGMIGVSLIFAATFFGGYHFILVDKLPILGPIVMIAKVVLFLMGFIWIRATLPRIRYDRLMQLGWKILLPLGFLSVAWTAVAVVVGDELGGFAYMLVSLAMLVVVGVAGYFLTRNEDPAEEEDYEDDPVITGERAGLGFAVLQVVGGLIAIPFVLYEFTLKMLEGIGRLDGGEPETGDAEESAPALPSESGGD
jgi:NADH-quinone oxidoreductase subunit H